MIKLDISIALFIYLFCTVIVTFALWIWMEKKARFTAFKIDRKNVWQCSVCKYVYLGQKDEDFARCPRCSSINKKGVRNL